MSRRILLPILLALSLIIPSRGSAADVTPVENLADPDLCKLSKYDNPATDFVGTSFLGFPTPEGRIKPSGTINGVIIGVDFADLPSKSKSPKKDYSYITPPMTKWFETLSRGEMKINWRFNSNYVRMPKKLVDYGIGGRGAGSGPNFGPYYFADQVIQSAQTSFDFTGTDFVIIAPPLNTSMDQISTGPALPAPVGGGYKYPGGEVLNATMISASIISSKPYSPWFGSLPLAHEIGHLMGLTDLYSVGNSNPGGKYEDQFKYMGIFSFMNYAGPNGNAIVPTAWEQWQVGWLKNPEIRCVRGLVNSTHEITYLESKSIAPKAIVIPVSRTKAIVVESRRKIGYDSDMPASAAGALVYTVNTLTSTGTGAMQIVRKRSSKALLFQDAPLKSNESVEILGYRITNLKSGTKTDLIQVKRIDGKQVEVPLPSKTPISNS